MAIQPAMRPIIANGLLAVLALLITAGGGLSGCGQGASQPPAGARDNANQTATPGDEPSQASAQTLHLRGQSDVRIDGRTISADPSIVIENCEGVTIINCDLRRVEVRTSANVRIVNSQLHDCAQNAVYLDACTDVLVQGNRIERVRTGVLAHRCTGVRVIGNYVEDVQGPMPGGQLVQFDKVTGPGNVIAQNYGINHRGQSQPEDMVSIYQSHGTQASPILIENNYLTGDPEHGSAGKSDSGSGIMLGDGGGSWQLCRNNTLVSPGQVGIGVASGENITVQSNVVIGHRSNVSNVGLYVWNQYDRPAGRVNLRSNTVVWVNAQGDYNPYWDGGGFASVALKDNTFSERPALEGVPVPEPPSVAPQPPVPFVEPVE